MSKTIKISYRWDRENFEKLFDASYKYQFNHSAKRYIGWLFIAILQLGVVAALKKDSVALLLFASLVLLYWYFGKKFIAKKRASKVFNASPFKDKTIRIEVDEDGFKIQNQESNVAWHWDEIDEVTALNEDVIIYKEPNFHYIPSSGFSSIEDKSHFKTMAKSHHKLKV
jgi:hypothetical protein